MKANLLFFGMLLAIGGVIRPSAPAQAAHDRTAANGAGRNAAWTRAFAAPEPPSTSGTPVGRENRLNNDPRFTSLLRASFPQRQWIWYEHGKLAPLPEMMETFLGVPGNAILDEDRYVTLDGCVPHDCDMDRGMLWIDTGVDPAVLIFAGIDPIGGSPPPYTYTRRSHLWIYSSEKLSWQKIPAPFLSSLHRWLATIGENRYFGTDGYRYDFLLATIVQPNGVMEDLGPDTLGLGATKLHANSGA